MRRRHEEPIAMYFMVKGKQGCIFLSHSPIQTTEETYFLGCKLPGLLGLICKCLLGLELTRSVAADACTSSLNTLVDTIPFYSTDLELCVRAPDVERVRIFAL